MSRSTFDLLLSPVHDLLNRRFVAASDYSRETILAEIRPAIILRMFAGGSCCDICSAYQIKELTIFEFFNSTSYALMERLHLEGFPKTKVALQSFAQGFQTSRPDASSLFGCLGALDGICVKIKKPAISENQAFLISRRLLCSPSSSSL